MDVLISDLVNQPLLLVAPTIHEFNAIQYAVKDQLAGGRIELSMSGMGMHAITAFCRVLEGRSRPLSGLALLGWAGGLSPDLQAGDVVIASSAMNTRGGQQPCKVIPLTGATIGPVMTVPAPVITPQEKNAHRASGALAIEMEAYHLAAWAQARGLPFIHARVVLDTVDESLPDLGNALDVYGRASPLQLTIRLLARPQLIGQLFHLYRKIRILAPSLGWLAGAVAQSWFEQYPLPDVREVTPTRG